MVYFRNVCAISLITFVMTTSSFATAGIGFHWGNDLTLQMEDTKKEWLGFKQLSINPEEINLGNLDLPTQLEQGISGKYLPIYLSRTDWERTNFNFGGKIYVDIIPIIDALELSCNFGLWQYEGSISYPKSIKLKNYPYVDLVKNPEDLFEVTYEKVPLTLKHYDMSYFGLEGTPYAKLGFDLTARKYILKFPPAINLIRIYGGAGLSLNFATPIINRSIIETALGETLKDAFSLDNLNADLFSNDKLMKKILEELLSRMMTPHLGCHIDLGAMINIPLLPVGIYLDGRYLLPFDSMDENVDLGGNGLLINIGICLSF